MTKKNLIIVIILLSVIDLVAAGWYMSRRIETGNKGDSLFGGRDSTDVITEADTVVTTNVADVFDKEQHNAYYYIGNTPAVGGDKSTCYTSIKHVKVRWPQSINGNEEIEELNKALISKAFGNSHSQLKDARYVYLNTPTFNKPMGDDYHSSVKAPRIVPIYGNVSQVLVYPYMTSQRLLVMKVDKVEYNGHATVEDNYFIHYDRVRHRVLSRIDILTADVSKENQLLMPIHKKIDNLNRSRGDSNRLQHALNVPAELCCSSKGILFQFRQGSISSGPVEVQIDYDDVKPYLTERFAQMLANNEDYHIYKESLKPEAVNASKPQPAYSSVSAPAPEKEKSTASNAYSSTQHKKSKYNNGYYHKKSHSNRYYRGGNYYHRNDSKGSYSNSGNNYQQQSVKQGYKSRKYYSGAKRKSGRYGYSGKRHWNRRRR